MLRYWNRLVILDDDRLTKAVFEWQYENITRSSLLNKVLLLLRSLEMENAFHAKQPVSLDLSEQKMMEIFTLEWKVKIEQTPKLRTYKHFKDEFGTECYVYKIHDRSQRSILAQLRSGILPLQIEIGRFSNTPVENRRCLMCENNQIEDEFHFLFHCEFYVEERHDFEFNLNIPDYQSLVDEDRMKYLMSEEYINNFAKYVQKCFLKRRNILFK